MKYRRNDRSVIEADLGRKSPAGTIISVVGLEDDEILGLKGCRTLLIDGE